MIQVECKKGNGCDDSDDAHDEDDKEDIFIYVIVTDVSHNLVTWYFVTWNVI